jgi:hypothetical protein
LKSASPIYLPAYGSAQETSLRERRFPMNILCFRRMFVSSQVWVWMLLLWVFFSVAVVPVQAQVTGSERLRKGSALPPFLEQPLPPSRLNSN